MKKLLFFCAFFLVLAACKPKSTVSSASNDSSDISFSGVNPGTLNWSANAGWEAQGTFDKWKFVKFDVENNDFSKVNAEIAVQISSVNHDDKGLENHLRKNDYLAAKKFPVATININGATFNEADNSYYTNATVSLKGAQKEVPLTFSIDNNTVKGNGTLFREDYNVGDDSGVRNEVMIDFEFSIPE